MVIQTEKIIALDCTGRTKLKPKAICLTQNSVDLATTHCSLLAHKMLTVPHWTVDRKMITSNRLVDSPSQSPTTPILLQDIPKETGDSQKRSQVQTPGEKKTELSIR